jgi:uncharacterized protein DUF2442
LLKTAESLRPEELNAIYAGWGDHFRDELRPGIRLMYRCVTEEKSVYARQAAPLLHQWDDWLQANWSPILALLRDKYGFEVQ